MKAVATALVLIVGAAVVLWYGNTLNSWVLGGLIGGLAALLISIPISLTLFSYLSRRHEDAYGEERQERVSLAQVYEYQDDAQEMLPYADEVEGSLYPLDEESWDEQAEAFRTARPSSRLSTSAQQRAPLVRSQTLKKLPAPIANTPGKISQGQRTTRRLSPPTSSSFSQHRSQALRAARREAGQQFDGAMETPTRTVRPVQPQPLQRRPPIAKRASRQLNSQAANVYPKQPRQRYPETGTTQREAPRSAPLHDRSTGYIDTTRQRHGKDFLRDNYPQTEPIDRSTQTGRRHDTRMRKQDLDPEVITESLQRPLVRRAPYMYDDDPLREEFSQYLDNPIVRRSSRFDSLQQDDQEQ